jgi:hypothetical protein
MSYIYELLPLKFAKIIGNVFIGGLNRKYLNRDLATITDTPEFVISMALHYDNLNSNNKSNRKFSFKLKELNDLYWLRATTKIRKNRDTSPIHQAVMAGALIQYTKMLKSIWKPSYKLIGCKTDAFSILPNSEQLPQIPLKEFNNEKQYSLELVNKYPYKFEKQKLLPRIQYPKSDSIYDETQFKKWNVTKIPKTMDIKNRLEIILKLKSCCIQAPGGAGKTFLLAHLSNYYEEILNKTVAFLSFQGSVVSNFINKCNEINIEPPSYCGTIDSLMGRILSNG